jgi:murein DD-endopeptidase MepM/ murein hydrolase activator NlpD
MSNFYYFSKTRLKFVEIKNFNKKFLISVGISTFLLTSLLFGGFYFINSIINSDSEIANLKYENKNLSKKIKELVVLYEKLNLDLADLSQTNDELRIAANLPPIPAEEKLFGTGGSSFGNIPKLISSNSSIDVDKVTGYIESIQNKFEFEKRNYLSISKKLKENQKLFAALPAIKPSNGTFGSHGFGMRFHPVLGYTRMHEGVDIITDVGTPVKASGSGSIDFVGYRNGLGLCIELDHGFGYRTVYGHLSSVNVKIGDKIKRAQIIAKTGNTGLSSGPHLHYEVIYNGVKQNPMDFIFDDFIAFEPSLKK